MGLGRLEFALVVLFGLNAVCGQLPFGLSAAKFFGYDGSSKPIATTECITENKHPGTCMSRKECNQHNGAASGSCGNGVCCEISMGCGKVSRAKKTVIRNPSPIPDYCGYHFRPYSKLVCQLRVDFSAKIGAPTIPNRNQDGSFVKCEDSYIKLGKYKLCGVNKNQHVYLPFSAEFDLHLELGLTIVHKEAEFAATDYWDIIVTQIECPPKADEDIIKRNQLWDWTLGQKSVRYDKDLIAPEGCLQYYTERNGVIESFNYNNGKGPYLGNMRYSICFRKKQDDHSILFEATKFNLNANRYDHLETDLNCYDSSNPRTSKDYILIPDSLLLTPQDVTPVVKLEASKYCGSILQGRQLHYSSPGPFVIIVNTDKRYNANSHIYEGGFRIKYTKNLSHH